MITIPRQVFGASSTHSFCNNQGIIILQNDGYEHAARLFNRFINELNKGVTWADKGCRSTTHHYNPETGRGFWLFPSSVQKCDLYYNRSIEFWRMGKQDRAIFLIGAAVHLVQDACVPHHSMCRMYNGHMQFENWVENHKNDYKVHSGGLYDRGQTPLEWIAANARVSGKHYTLIHKPDSKNFDQVASILLPLSQQTTAGFLNFCYTRFLCEVPLHF